jgi:formiminotetrahydrofolate cyclodeaminase
VTSFVTQPTLNFLTALASSKPTPAGGSAAAMAAAMGTGLLVKVAHIARRTCPEDERTALEEAIATLELLWRKLADAIDRDAEAYDRVVAVARGPAPVMPVQAALTLATEAPLDVMRLAVEALAMAPTVAAHSPSSVSGDVDTAVELVAAGLRGAFGCVKANLDGLHDRKYVAQARQTTRNLTRRARVAVAKTTRRR